MKLRQSNEGTRRIYEDFRSDKPFRSVSPYVVPARGLVVEGTPERPTPPPGTVSDKGIPPPSYVGVSRDGNGSSVQANPVRRGCVPRSW